MNKENFDKLWDEKCIKRDGKVKVCLMQSMEVSFVHGKMLIKFSAWT